LSSDDNVEAITQFFAALERGEIREDLIHPDFEMTNVEDFLFTETYRGRGGFKTWHRDVIEAMRDPHWELQVAIPVADDRLIARHRLTAHTHAADLDLDLVWWSACWFRDRMVWRVVGARTRDEALELIGGE
jgi:ketosteroid isomerase-like protein